MKKIKINKKIEDFGQKNNKKVEKIKKIKKNNRLDSLYLYVPLALKII